MPDEVLDELKKLREEIAALRKDYALKTALIMKVYNYVAPPNGNDWYQLRFQSRTGELLLGERAVEFSKNSIERHILKRMFFKDGKAKKRKFTINQLVKFSIYDRYEYNQEQIKSAVIRILNKTKAEWQRDDILLFKNDCFYVNSKFTFL